jgi:hypothetical protein
MRILVVLLLVLVGGLVLVSRFGQAPGEPDVVAGAPGGDGDAESPEPAEAVAPDETSSGPEEVEAGARTGPAPPVAGDAAQDGSAQPPEPATEAPATEPQVEEDGSLTLRLEPDAEESVAPDAASPSAEGPSLPEAPPAEAGPALRDPLPSETAATTVEPEATVAEPELPLPEEPLDPEQALAELAAQPEAPRADAPVRPDDGGEAGSAVAEGSPPEEGAPPGREEPAGATSGERIEPPPPEASPEVSAEEESVATPPTAGTESQEATVAEPLREFRRLTGDRVNLREGPGTDERVLAILPIDSEVEVIEAQDEWLRVRTNSGLVGWVAARFVAPRSE